MAYSEIYLYSPLSPHTVCEGQNRALLLQFILSEIFHAKDAHEKDDPLEFVFSSPACFFPYDWSCEVGCINKIEEHGHLLEYAFPELQEATEQFHACLEEALRYVTSQRKIGEEISTPKLKNALADMVRHLQPFLIAAKESENLLLFLLKNGGEFSELCGPATLPELLKRLYPDGLEKITGLLKQGYQSRGFDTLLPEIDRLIVRVNEA